MDAFDEKLDGRRRPFGIIARKDAEISLEPPRALWQVESDDCRIIERQTAPAFVHQSTRARCRNGKGPLWKQTVGCERRIECAWERSLRQSESSNGKRNFRLERP